MKKTLIAVFTIFVMVVAACGGSDSGSDNESSQKLCDREYNVTWRKTHKKILLP